MKKLLVANRGEIALRVMRSAREMGIRTVAIYSEADRNSPHVMFADEAFCIGPAPSNQSYLRGDAIIELCKAHNIDAIHPGYGFLSENSTFARAVSAAGITFVGPSPEAMDLMGSKLAAKAAVKNYDVPLVPGTDEAITDVEAAKQIAFDEPIDAAPFFLECHKCGFATALRTEAMTGFTKERVEVALQTDTHDFLCQLIAPDGQPQNAAIAVRFWDGSTAGGLPAVRAVTEVSEDRVNPLEAHPVNGFIRDAASESPLVLSQPAIGGDEQGAVLHTTINTPGRFTSSAEFYESC